MKKKVTGLKVFLQLAAVLSIVGFHSIAQAQVVNLQANDSQTKLTITSPGSCARANTNGCLRVSGQAQINFNLVGSPGCSLSHVALGNSDGSQGNISAVAASDFNANQATGVVTPVSQSGNHILIRDNNSQAYEVWYTVVAQCGDSTIDSDPRIVNDGSGNP